MTDPYRDKCLRCIELEEKVAKLEQQLANKNPPKKENKSWFGSFFSPVEKDKLLSRVNDRVWIIVNANQYVTDINEACFTSNYVSNKWFKLSRVDYWAHQLSPQENWALLRQSNAFQRAILLEGEKTWHLDKACAELFKEQKLFEKMFKS